MAATTIEVCSNQVQNIKDSKFCEIRRFMMSRKPFVAIGSAGPSIEMGGAISQYGRLAFLAAVAVLLQAAPVAAQWDNLGREASGRVDISIYSSQFDPYIRPAFPYSGPYESLSLHAWKPSRQWSLSRNSEWLPDNKLFDDFPYAFDCSDSSLTVVPASTYTPSYGLGQFGTPQVVPARTACRITNAPVVDMKWVHDNLEAQGYLYSISYPFKDSGNGRAIVNWVKGCMVGNYPGYCYAGAARVEGAGWQKQFPDDLSKILVVNNASKAYSLDVIRKFPAAAMNASVVVRTWTSGLWINLGGHDSLFPIYTVMMDDWLSGTPPSAALPSIQPYVPAGEPSAINVGGASSGGGAGAAGETNTDGRNTLKFDFAAYCNAPGKDGQPRSPAWVENCMARR